MKKVITFVMTIVLTASLGRISYAGHTETWYNLPMDNVIQRTDEKLGITDRYWIRPDGVRMYAQWVIVAADPSVTRYTLVETSLGTGIVLDTQTTGEKDLYDIATVW